MKEMHNEKELMDYAKAHATCTRLKVAAVVVLNGEVIGRGVNDSPGGAVTCEEVGCLMIDGHCKRTIHAEVNAILEAMRSGWSGSLKDAVLYVTHEPCYDCTKYIAQSGIRKVFYTAPYRSNLATDQLKQQLDISIERR